MVLQSLVVAASSLHTLKFLAHTGQSNISPFFSTDNLSGPLICLACWLLPLTIIASQDHMESRPINNQRAYLTALITLQALLILAFATNELISFYVIFEATLIPTLFIITRWGTQKARLNAGTYFLFYTLAGSLPLLVALLFQQLTSGSLSLVILTHLEM